MKCSLLPDVRQFLSGNSGEHTVPYEKAARTVFVAWRDLRFAKGRFALMGAVVVLITLLVGLLSGLTAGLGRQNTSAITALPADRIAFEAPADGQDLSYAESVVTESQWQRVAATAGVTAAEPVGISTAKATAGDARLTVSAFGVRSGSALVPGGAPENEDTAVLTAPVAESLGVSPGDVITLAGRDLVVGTVHGDESFGHLPVIWIDLDTWQTTAPPAETHTEPAATFVALRTTADFDSTATDRLAGTTTVPKDSSLSAIGSYASENGSLQLMRGFLFAISALVIGAFFTVWTVQRSGDIAVLEALGASTGRLVRDALGQAVVLLVGGTALGTALAAAAGAALAGSVPFALTPAALVIPAAVMITLGSLGAAVAVRRITSVDPLTALGSAR
ncbi:ABC transporter permease [Rhodococcus sp. CH91]|uniref:ABC transporter permease n=1 Tax=Rhodococcus sp. CH91 TaxID=2910256 RepID=UPI001F4A69FD|nr:ABC transporter permease [Rhodococcus sp. CH91]